MGSANWYWFAKEWKSRSLWLWVRLDNSRSPLLFAAAFSPMSFTTALAPLMAALQVMASAWQNAQGSKEKRGINPDEWYPWMCESQLARSLTNLSLFLVFLHAPPNIHIYTCLYIPKKQLKIHQTLRINRIFSHHVCVPTWLAILPLKNLSGELGFPTPFDNC